MKKEASWLIPTKHFFLLLSFNAVRAGVDIAILKTS